MRRFDSYRRVLLSLTVVGMLATACDDNDEITVDPDADFDVVLDVPTETNENVDVTADQGEILAKIHFVSPDDKMRRLYITKNVGGAGEEVFIPEEKVDDKPDHSIDLASKSGTDFEFQFKLDVPDGITAGTVVYKFWTTTGVGDFRDQTKRLAVGPGTITLKYGNGNNQAAPVKSFEDKVLGAPLQDGSSNTFISLVDGTVYPINKGADLVYFWDFGYMYLKSGNLATLSSANIYNPQVVDIKKLTGITEELNKVYFQTSTKTSADFNAIKTSAELSSLTVAKTNEEITKLTVGQIVEFETEYGKKGLIRVDKIENTDGSDGRITIDIKVQP